MAKKIGVVLSGCGVFDGSEIHEAVLTMLALDRAGAHIVCMAPNVSQMHVVNHIGGKPVPGEARNAMIESARIARGEIKDIKDVAAKDIDALIFPGGYGAVKNLCTFAVDGAQCKVNPEVERLVQEMHAAKKPSGFICIAPAIAAKVLGKHKPKLTIGNDAGTAKALQTLGAEHVNCKVDEVAVDQKNKLVSTPAYMLGPSIAHVARGIDQCVAKLLELA